LERRRHPRFATNEPVEVILEGAIAHGVVRDVSSSGACIVLGMPAEVDAEIIIRSSFVQTAAVVRHMAVVPDGYLVGIEFKTLISVPEEIARSFPAEW
jgi:PilZ domain